MEQIFKKYYLPLFLLLITSLLLSASFFLYTASNAEASEENITTSAEETESAAEETLPAVEDSMPETPTDEILSSETDTALPEAPSEETSTSEENSLEVIQPEPEQQQVPESESEPISEAASTPSEEIDSDSNNASNPETTSEEIQTVLEVQSDSENLNQSSTPEAQTETTTDTFPEVTPAINSVPTIQEEITEKGKLVTVSATEEQELVHQFIDVPVRTEIPEVFRVGEENKIKIFWQNNNNELMEFIAFDEDANGFIDHIEWIVPHLSTQIFEIIFISKALLLDVDGNAIANIYESVNTRDGNYATATNGQTVRVTFEKALDNTKDITIYARATNENEPAMIEVYTLEGELIATFSEIAEDGKYRILLTSLQGEADTFDLKIIGNI